jgi:hypothetical protein
MANVKKRVNFFASDEGATIRKDLHSMVESTLFNTRSSYIASDMVYSDHQIPFVDKHMDYLNTHPKVNPDHYISNLRLITRIR